jgi:hypothetical protein
VKWSALLSRPANLHLKGGTLPQRHGDGEVGGAVGAAEAKRRYDLLRWRFDRSVASLQRRGRGATILHGGKKLRQGGRRGSLAR